MKLAQRLNIIPEYIFSLLNKKVVDIEKQSGKNVLNFSIGSPDFPPNEKYIQRLKDFIIEPSSHLYPGYGASREFSDALQTWYSQRFGVNISHTELHPLLGAKDGISHLPLALLDAGDEVLIPDPGYPAYSSAVLLVGAKPVFYNLTEQTDFKIDINELEKLVTPKTKCIWVNFPGNPTGQVVNIDDLKEIVEFARKYKIWLLYDNAYSEITFNGYIAPSVLQIEGAKEVAIEIGSFSKTFSFAGYRMGWIVGNPMVISALAKVKSQLDSGLSLPLQKLGSYVLTHYDINWHQQMINDYQNRRDKIISCIGKLGLKADKYDGGLYLWVKIPDSYKDSTVFCTEILEKKQILFTPGTAFGKNGNRYVRISFCVDITNINQYL